MSTTRAADAAVEAIRDLKPAKLSYQRSEAKRISFGRRYLMKDGNVRTNPGTNNPDIVKPVGNPPDGSDGWGVATCGPNIRIGEGMTIPAHAMVYDSPEVEM